MSGASMQENYSEMVDDFSQFRERTGLLCSLSEVETLGFHVDNIAGTFWESHIPMLLDFCKENPLYHVVTSTRPGRFENKYIPHRNLYILAEGDKNPNLIFDIAHNKNTNLLYEEMFEEALAIRPSINRGYKTK